MKSFLIVLAISICFGAGLYYLVLPTTVRSVPVKNPIICFGDSITEGYILKRTYSYPHQLGLLIGEEIINTGISGESSGQGLKRLKKDVLDKNPRLVIVQFGGNDAYFGISREKTLANNDLIVEKIQKSGAVAVLLIGEANMLEPKYLQGFREIANRRKILLIEDAMDEIIKDWGLRVDGVHPNARGHKILAGNVARAVKPLLQGR